MWSRLFCLSLITFFFRVRRGYGDSSNIASFQVQVVGSAVKCILFYGCENLLSLSNKVARRTEKATLMEKVGKSGWEKRKSVIRRKTELQPEKLRFPIVQHQLLSRWLPRRWVSARSLARLECVVGGQGRPAGQLTSSVSFSRNSEIHPKILLLFLESEECGDLSSFSGQKSTVKSHFKIVILVRFGGPLCCF